MMLNYVLQNEEMNRLFRLLRDLLDMRITFFDVNNRELDRLDVKDMSSFCRHARRDPKFDIHCRACDAEHIAAARGKGDAIVYRCHAGLLEGVVPLFGAQRRYLGALVFGQLRPAEGRCLPAGGRLRQFYAALPSGSPRKMRQVALMLRYLGQYIIHNELIRLRSSDGMEQLLRYIDAHLVEPLTLQSLAAVVGRSPSFVSHHFRSVHGISPMRYLRDCRLERAAALVGQGRPLREVARRCGFCDEFHLSKSFRKRFGHSPRPRRHNGGLGRIIL